MLSADLGSSRARIEQGRRQPGHDRPVAPSRGASDSRVVVGGRRCGGRWPSVSSGFGVPKRRSGNVRLDVGTREVHRAVPFDVAKAPACTGTERRNDCESVMILRREKHRRRWSVAMPLKCSSTSGCALRLVRCLGHPGRTSSAEAKGKPFAGRLCSRSLASWQST